MDIKARALALLRDSLSNPAAEFHEDQWESISTLVEGRQRLLVVQRTGWGKSAVYFIATKLLREQGWGPTIIISPLLALMRNQIDSAAKYGVRLGSINSSQSDNENNGTITALTSNNLDAVIISPEQLSKPSFREDVLNPVADRVGLFVIDEAHCISDWGHDFRPDYKRIVNILPFLPNNMPVLATTATANQRVMDDVRAQLGREVQVYRGALTRESLHLQNIQLPNPSQRLAWLADTLPNLPGTGIIYTATTRDADLVANWLKRRGLNVAAYYGTLPNMTREASAARRLMLEDKLMSNQLKALVATSALGMGYDKPDLAFVIHYQSPGSVVTYYQQVGRAGRAIPKAYGVLLSGGEDNDIQEYFIRQAFPSEKLVAEILQTLESSDGPLKIPEILGRVNGGTEKAKDALKFLLAESPAPVVLAQQQPIKYARTVIDYNLPHEAIQRLSALKESEWRIMQQYVEHHDCLMNFLSQQLDDPVFEPCGRCANCAPENALPETYRHETGLDAAAFLENVMIEIQPRDRVSVSRFPQDKLPSSLKRSNLQHEPGRALCRWGEAGWGEIAMHGKRDGHFDERLVGASAKLILQRWCPAPFPTWVTFVPSHQHSNLVKDFAAQLAQSLGLPCMDLVKKIRKNRPQKTMQNAEFQSKNLDGVFRIEPGFPAGPVLLVDDAVDSKWTFTVISALLIRAGAGPVFPFAIMSTSTSD
ncbi:MAG: RecQ family ATP-dependent DNA helicase [Pseudohongiellaceae bacterium]